MASFRMIWNVLSLLPISVESTIVNLCSQLLNSELNTYVNFIGSVGLLWLELVTTFLPMLQNNFTIGEDRNTVWIEV